jgi:hypothetical protein
VTLYPLPTTPGPSGVTPAPQITPALSFNEIPVTVTPTEVGPFGDLLGSILRFFGQLLHR